MSQPEWQDLDIDPEIFTDEGDFYGSWETLAKTCPEYVRPSWYNDTCIYYPPPPPPSAVDVREQLSSRSRLRRFIREIPCARTFYRVTCRIISRAGYLSKACFRAVKKMFLGRRVESGIAKLCKFSKDCGPIWCIEPSELRPYLQNAFWLDQFVEKDDVIFGYVCSSIYGMLIHDHPVVAVEIGTIRDIPFDGTLEGKIAALMYRAADHVIITNPDNKLAADRLGLKSISFCPHPVDEDVYRPLDCEVDLGVVDGGSALKIFAPARQNWKEKGNDKLYRAVSELLRRGVSVKLSVPEWGQDLSRSRELVEMLGISHAVQWLAPQSEKRLIHSYQDADVVVDQFIHGVFGLITPKALACGKPVVTSYRPELNRWCFPEDPPLLPASDEGQIVMQLEKIATDPKLRRAVGQASRQWVVDYHSKDAVFRALKEAEEFARASCAKRRKKGRIE